MAKPAEEEHEARAAYERAWERARQKGDLLHSEQGFGRIELHYTRGRVTLIRRMDDEKPT